MVGKKGLWLIGVSLFLSFNLAYAVPPFATEIKPGLWVGSKIVDGQKLYFALENRPGAIQAFKNFANNMGNGSNKSLNGAIDYVALHCPQMTAQACLASKAMDVFSGAGLDTPAKKIAFFEYIFGSTIKGDQKSTKSIKIATHMEGLAAGANHAGRPGQDMFAWMSTAPITDYREFGYPGSKNFAGGGLNIEQAYSSNHDLTILVSASFNNVPYSKLNKYINIAGIFKTPHEILYGDHKNIALLFHGYIAHVARLNGKTVYFIRDPASPMAALFQEAVDGKLYRGVAMSSKEYFSDIDATHVAASYRFKTSEPIFASTVALEKMFTESK
jgi:hypothetical protein